MTITQAPDVDLTEYLDFVDSLLLGAVSDILAHMDDELPNECVGMLWADGSIQRLVNQARSPDRFAISQPQMAERLADMPEGSLLTCFYHSHPGGSDELSNADRVSLKAQFSRELFIPWAIVTQTSINMFWMDDDDKILSRNIWEQ